MFLKRADRSKLGLWWWSIDKKLLAIIAAIIVFGIFLIIAASPYVAAGKNLSGYYFITRQFMFLPASILVILFFSFQSPKRIRLFSFIGFVVFYTLVIGTLFVGFSAKGAARWINLFGQQIQPSEFLKPFFVVLSAWVFSQTRLANDGKTFKSIKDKSILSPVVGLLAVLFLLVLQPDFGMSFVVAAVWLFQLFLAGLPIILVLGALGLIALGGGAAYLFSDHFRSRVFRFLNPEISDNYQVMRSLQAMQNGGLFGSPGEGVVKEKIPDAHTDFIFAVAGEEFGAVVCIVILGLYIMFFYEVLKRARKNENMFVQLAAAGLAAQFTLQALINIGSTINLIPTKGMTLPFISYGGSSLIATGIGVGMILSLTRDIYYSEEET